MEQSRLETAAEADIVQLASEIRGVIDHMRSFEGRFVDEIAKTHPKNRRSAANLVHYLALRQIDLRDLQQRLATLGLSSLGRTEAHVMASIQAVAGVLDALRTAGRLTEQAYAVAFRESAELLAEHTAALFGALPNGRSVRIMVTLPTEAANDYALVRDLVAAGMDVARINCGRDDEMVWQRMADHVRKARRETGRSCRISMDLAGHKPRTGLLEPGPEVVRWKPQRDLRGRVVKPARVWLTPDGTPAPEHLDCSVSLPVDDSWVADVCLGDTIHLRDARGKKRRLTVVERWGSGIVGESETTAYIETGTILTRRKNGRSSSRTVTRIGPLPAVEIPIRSKEGDMLILTKDAEIGRPARWNADLGVEEPARIACTLPEMLDDVKVGEPVKFDDGRIEGIVTALRSGEVCIEITRAGDEGRKLRAGRGINFPESELHVTGMSARDVSDLDLIVSRADIVGLSFASSPEDVFRLQEELVKHGADEMGIVLKIETKHGFQRLPGLLLAAMRSYPIGIMIARGDLAVECGWERTAEIQEEILWLCEAAHIPVIWATQVLEGLAQKGVPSRAEITDAAMAERAECVMLNKGPYILKAMRTLDDLLRRMQGHQTKKTALLRSLNVSNDFLSAATKIS